MEFNYQISSKGFELFYDHDSMSDHRYTIDVELVEEQVHLAFIGPYVDGHIIVTKDDTDLDYQIKQECELSGDLSSDQIIGGICFLLQRDDELLIQKISDYIVSDLRNEFPLAFSDAKKICFDRSLNPIHDGAQLVITHPIYLNETLILKEGIVMNSHRAEGFYYDREIYLKLIDDATGVELLVPSKFIALKEN